MFSRGWRIVLVLGGMVIGGLALTGCGGAAGPRPSAGATLVYGRGEDARTLDPINTDTGESVKVIVNLYDTLVAYADETLDLEPSLATQWTTSDDGLVWSFTLREGVLFHDGSICDAEAVRYSFARLLDETHPDVHDYARPYRSSYEMIDSIETPGPWTVVFRLKRPSAVFLKNLAMFPASIVSPAGVRAAGKSFAVNPVGTGPFRFVRWLRDQQIVLAANDRHWRGRPRVDRVVFVPVSESATRVQQLLRGDIHLADDLPPQELDALSQRPGIVVQEQAAMNVAYLAFQTERPPFQDRRVREAIARALDKAALVNVAYAGHAQPAVSLVPPNMWGHDAQLVDRGHDPAAARALLEQAARDGGWKLPLAVSLAVMSEPRPYMEQPLQVAAFVKDALAEVGVLATIDPKPVHPHFDRMMRGDFELGLAGWTSDNSDPDNFLFSLLDSSNISEHGNNLSRFRHDDLHELLLSGQTELRDEARLAIYRQVQQIAFTEVPVAPLVHTQQRVAQRANLKGYRLHPATLQRLRHAYFEDAGP